jgi:superfamily II DNA or RNA helicase
MVKITLVDEINANIDGLTEGEFDFIVDKVKFPVKDAFMRADFQMKLWDGKESMIDEDGNTYQYYLPEIVDHIESLGYSDDEVEIIDERLPLADIPCELVDDDFMLEESGMTLRESQTRNLNRVISELCGILDACTSAGKTLTCGGIAKYFEDYLCSITIVPTAKLLRQTTDEFKEWGLNTVAIDAKMSQKKRNTAIDTHQHIVITSKLLWNQVQYEVENNDYHIVGEQMVVMYDELHKFGETMIDTFRYALNNCPVRIGMTGTVPNKDKVKLAHIKGCLGGDVIDTVSVKYAQDMGYAATSDITGYITYHPEVEELCTPQDVKDGDWDWETEFRYYHINDNRVESIANFISSLEVKNTLILCHPALGHKLDEFLGDLSVGMIDKDTDEDTRDKYFNFFDTKEDLYLTASFETSATGISKNSIYRIIEIDVGKNETYIKQGIGRGLRLDGEINHCEIIDISANTYYAKKHRKDRVKLYKSEGHPYHESKLKIHVGE